MSLTINSFGYSSISSLFSNSLNNSMFNGLESSLTNYSQIRSGSYGKLVESYYDKYDYDGNLKSDTSSKKSSSSSESDAKGYLAVAREEKERTKLAVSTVDTKKATDDSENTEKSTNASTDETLKGLNDIKSYTSAGSYAKTMDDLLSTFDTTT